MQQSSVRFMVQQVSAVLGHFMVEEMHRNSNDYVMITSKTL